MVAISDSAIRSRSCAAIARSVNREKTSPMVMGRTKELVPGASAPPLVASITTMASVMISAGPEPVAAAASTPGSLTASSAAATSDAMLSPMFESFVNPMILQSNNRGRTGSGTRAFAISVATKCSSRHPSAVPAMHRM